MHTTSHTLLGQLRDIEDRAAWNRFVGLYTPLMYAWCCRAGLQEADASDIVQDVFSILVKKLPEFRHDRVHSFRSWLRTVVMNRWRELGRRKNPAATIAADLDDFPAKETFDEGEYRREVVRRAMEMLEPEFRRETWTAFVQHGLLRRPADRVAEETGLTVGAVYAARCRVIARIQTYLHGLLD